MDKRKWRVITPALLLMPVLLLFAAGADAQNIRPGAWRTDKYVPDLAGKRVAIVANQTSTIGNTHLVDSLKRLGVKITKVFAPEHGFRGSAAAGEKVKNSRDIKTGIPVVSLYGKKYKPTPKELRNVDIILFDIQDVGTRFYTYLSTLHYVMQACAENNKPLFVLDRPNPNGYYTDGPVLKPGYESMVGLHPIPIVHGMTLGELALMINGQGWLNTTQACDVIVIKNEGWDHNTRYHVPVPPSPNLPTDEAILLYPTLCLLEGTVMSMGRGTDKPFECFGAPWLKEGNYMFVPRNIPGKAINPPFVNDTCHGFLVTDFARNYIADSRTLYIEWLELLVSVCPSKDSFFTPFFDKLAGSSTLREQLLNGIPAKDIRKSWKDDLEAFEYKRTPYLLYPYTPGAGLTKP